MEKDKNNLAGYIVPIENEREASVKAYSVGSEGFDFILSRLNGSDPLSDLIKNDIGENNTVFSPLEDGLSVEQVKQFKWGKDSPTVEIKKWIADYINANWGNDYQLIFVDPWYGPDEYADSKPSCRYFFAESKPYLAPQNNSAYEDLAEADTQVESFDYIGFIISPALPLPPEGNEVKLEYLEELAKNTKALLVSAYAHEGYVILER